MFPPEGAAAEDVPLIKRVARWLDWWFTPRWRALCTWLALTGAAREVLTVSSSWWFHIAQLPVEYLNRFLPAPLPPVFNTIPGNLTFLLMGVWFQPLALRLNLRRALAWIGLSLVAQIIWNLLHSFLGYYREWTWPALQCGAAALQCWVLRGWRSRPWMCLLAQVATSSLLLWKPLGTAGYRYWLRDALNEFPHAALLLYGTRLLRPEERTPDGAEK